MSLRNGIRHFRDITTEELQYWCSGTGQLQCDVTEKTDGMAFSIGWDDDYDRHYTRTAHSPRTYRAEEYRIRAKAKFGENFNPAISDAFIEAHNLLCANPALKNHTRLWNTELSGEMFLRSLGEVDGDRIKFVGTWYDLEKIPAQGTFVVHSRANPKMPRIEALEQWTSRYLKIDHDEVFVDVSPFIADMDIDQAEVAVRQWLDKVPGRWGDEQEGYVLHKLGFLPIKLMNPSFYANKRKF